MVEEVATESVRVVTEVANAAAKVAQLVDIVAEATDQDLKVVTVVEAIVREPKAVAKEVTAVVATVQELKVLQEAATDQEQRVEAQADTNAESAALIVKIRLQKREDTSRIS